MIKQRFNLQKEVWRRSMWAVLLILLLTAGAVWAANTGDPSCPAGAYCLDFGDFNPVSIDADTGVTFPSAPAFGALIYDPDFKKIEAAAREKLKRGLDARVALSPYQGNLDFETYVKKFSYEAGWTRTITNTDITAYGEGLSLIDLINRADQDLREARDLYAYLLVYAPEYRFQEDNDNYMGQDSAPPEFSDYWGATHSLCGDPEDPDPVDPDFSGQVLPPVIDWCDFRARLRQSVREAANLRMVFGQQFMVDALGLHFSGTDFYGGEAFVRNELAQLRAAKNQYELAEQGLAEALDRVVGSGCYVSDFYTQSEWSLLSRAVEQQETTQHHIAVRLSYLDISSPEAVPAAEAAAQEAFRQATIDGYLKMIGMASLSAGVPSGIGCAVGERPDGQLAADMASNLLETRRKSQEMADGRNIFGFDVTFTPARRFENETFETCEATAPGERGLWDEAYCAAEYAKKLQSDEAQNTRIFDDSQKELIAATEKIRVEINNRIWQNSGCLWEDFNDDAAWYACVDEQLNRLNTCMGYVSVFGTDKIGNPTPGEFETCMDGKGSYPVIYPSEARQALYDLRAAKLQQRSITLKADNIYKRINLSDDRNAIVKDWLGKKGYWERAARVAEVAYEAVNCIDFGSKEWNLGLNIAGCAITTGVWAGMEGHAGTISMQADVEMEDAEHTKEIQNLLLDISELTVDAWAAGQQYAAKRTEVLALLDSIRVDVIESERQRAYFEHSPANRPNYRIVRDSARMQLAKQLAYASRMAYLAARRAEYEYAARLSASNFRISDIYRARTADDILLFLEQLRSRVNNLPGGTTNARDLKISVAKHILLLTDEALAKEGIPADQWETVRTARFREWVVANTVLNTFEPPYDGKPVLRFNLVTTLLEGGLYTNLIQQGYDGYWLHKMAGIGEPLAGNTGVSLNLLTNQNGLDYRSTRLTQGGTVHLRSHAGCIFDYRLMSPAFLLGLEWSQNQAPEVATASFLANVNGDHAYTENGYRAPEFSGRAVSSTDWVVLVFAGAPEAGLGDMDLTQLTDIELIFSTTYASRTPGDPTLSECTRIDW